jgi:hypothetical protein
VAINGTTLLVTNDGEAQVMPKSGKRKNLEGKKGGWEERGSKSGNSTANALSLSFTSAGLTVAAGEKVAINGTTLLVTNDGEAQVPNREIENSRKIKGKVERALDLGRRKSSNQRVTSDGGKSKELGKKPVVLDREKGERVRRKRREGG